MVTVHLYNWAPILSQLATCAVAWSNYLNWSEPRPPRVRRQFGVLLLATSASTSSPITRRRIGSHTGSRHCYVQGRLLQSAVGRSTKVCYRSLKLLNDSIFIPPVAIYSLFHGFSSILLVRPSHLRCRWTNDMELVPKQFAWAGNANWLFSSYTEDVSFWSVLCTLSALEAFLRLCAVYECKCEFSHLHLRHG